MQQCQDLSRLVLDISLFGQQPVERQLLLRSGDN